jgi:hypothetical protein
MATGNCKRSSARSRLVMTTATDPSVSWQQSNRWMHGSTIHREAWWSSNVIGR